jgi:hypothetical protein
MTQEHCPECGAPWPEGHTCDDDFHQMLFWEAEYPAYGAEVHHLMVLCFHMQHPGRYSAEGLQEGKVLLTEFVANGTSPQEMRRRNAPRVASDVRKTPITARPDNKGAYAQPVTWTMRAADVARADVHSYVANTRQWAQHVYDDLKASGNL